MKSKCPVGSIHPKLLRLSIELCKKQCFKQVLCKLLSYVLIAIIWWGTGITRISHKLMGLSILNSKSHLTHKPYHLYTEHY